MGVTPKATGPAEAVSKDDLPAAQESERLAFTPIPNPSPIKGEGSFR